MTGWRLGLRRRSRARSSPPARRSSRTTPPNATSFVQKAARGGADASARMEVERMRQEFERRAQLRASTGCAPSPASRAPRPPARSTSCRTSPRYLDKEFQGAPIRNTYGLSYYLLKEAHVALVPGEAFGTDEHIRISFATSMDRLEEGMKRHRAGARPARGAAPAAAARPQQRAHQGRRLRRDPRGRRARRRAQRAARRGGVAPARRTPTSSGTRRSPASSCSSAPRRRTWPTSSRRTSTRRRSRATSSRTR